MSTVAWVGAVLLFAAAIVYPVLLARLRLLDRAFPSTNPVDSTWWFGYARDLANLVGALGFAGGFWQLGLAPPLAVLAGASLTLVAYGLDYLYARAMSWRRAAVLLAGTLIALAVAAIALRTTLARALETLVSRLFA